MVASFWAGVSNIHAQYGVSPSQTGLFFDDLRARQKAEKAASNGTRNGDVVYDYESGTYRDDDSGEMGQRTVDYEEARRMSRPSVRSGSVAFAARSAGDYTNYAGQYTSPTGFFAPTYISDPFLNGRRNVRLGGLNIGFGLYQGFEYNSNINRSGVGDNPATAVDEGPISDVISTTLLNIDANYQITQNNRLSISTAIGFDHYFEHPELAPYGDGNFVLNVLPGSTIAFDMKAGPVYITVYNRMSVRPAARNDFALAQNQVFGVFQNDSGIAANWRINSAWSLAMNYMHSFSDSLQDQTNAFSRESDSIHGSLTFSPNGGWSVGLEGGTTFMSYDQNFNNDGVLTNIGAFAVLPVGSTTYLRVAAGYQNFSFDSAPLRFSGTLQPPFNTFFLNTGDQSNLSDFYYSLTLTNQLNSRLSHSLSIGHESALNVNSNYVTADYVNYGMSIIAWRGSKITLSGYLENARQSGGVFAQDLLQYGFDLYVSHKLTSKAQIGVGYHLGMTDPIRSQGTFAGNPNGGSAGIRTGADADFVQQAFNVDFTYNLSEKCTFTAGYRYYTTDVSVLQNGIDNDFSQHRIVTAINYNF